MARHVTEESALTTAIVPGRRWPNLDAWLSRTLSSLTFSGVVSFSVFGIATLENGVRIGLNLGSRAFCIVAPMAVGVAYGSPPVFAFLRWRTERMALVEPEDEPRNRARRRAPMPDPVVRSRGEARDSRPSMREQLRSLIAKGPSRRTKQAYAHERQPVRAEPRSDPDAGVAEFYAALTAMFGHSLVRDEWDRQLENGQALYRTYIGPRNADVGAWNEVGLWKRWRIVQQVDGRGKCEWVPGLTIDAILRMNRDLRRYAQRRGWRF